MRVAKGFGLLIAASRWRFWMYLAGPYLLGFTSGASSLAGFSEWRFWVHFLYFALPANLLLYGINDLCDTDTDALNPKKEGREVRLTDRQRNAIARAVWLAGILGLTLVVVQRNPTAAGALFAFLALCVLYSAPPIRFKARPILDSASNVLYACPMLVGYAQTAGTLPRVEVVMAALMWTSAMHLFSAIPDIESDKACGIRTSAVELGLGRALAVCSLLWMACCLLLWTGRVLLPWSLLAVAYPAIPAGLLFRRQRGDDVTKVYWLYPLLNSVAGGTVFFIQGAGLWRA